MTIRILYVEGNEDGTIGGSYFSLLYLISHLNKTKYVPMATFFFRHDLVQDFEEAGAKTFIMSQVNTLDFTQTAFFNNFKFLAKPLLYIQKAYNFIINFPLRIIRFYFFIKKVKADIVHLNNSVVKNHEWIVACMLGGVSIVTHERGINRSFTKSAKLFASRLDKIICISDAVQTNLVDKGISPLNLVTVYNGLNPDDCVVVNEPASLRNAHCLNDDIPIVGVVGNIKPWKGQIVLLEALKIIAEQYQLPCYGVLVGTTPQDTQDYKRTLDEYIEKNFLNNHVIFTGYVNNPADYMNLFDIVIHTSIDPEPFGRVLLEAMALEKPLIATAIGAPLEIIVDGETGLLVPPADAPALAAAIRTLLNDKSFAARIGRNGYERLIRHFSIAANVNATEKVYESLTT